MSRSGCSYEVGLLQHKFNPPELHARKYEVVIEVFLVVSALRLRTMGTQIPDLGSFEMGERLMGRIGYRYKLLLLQHFFYHLEPCHRRYSCVGALLGKFWALMGILGSSES